MTAIELLRSQSSSAHETLESVMAGVNDEQLHFVPAGTALPVAALYAHMVVSEDMLVSGMLQKKAPLCMTEWKEKTGLSEPMPGFEEADWGAKHAEWAKRVKVDLQAAQEYATAVYASTDAYLGSLTESDLDQNFDMSAFGMGEKQLGWVISLFVVGHVNNLMGEIAAVKGFQGMKGYPF